MLIAVDRCVVGTKRYNYAVDDVRGGRVHRTLKRNAWAFDVPDLEQLQSLVNQQGVLILEPDYETDAHLRGAVPSGETTMQWVAGFSLRRRGMMIAAIVLSPLIVEVIDRLNIIPGF
jgi:hypothetical protein